MGSHIALLNSPQISPKIHSFLEDLNMAKFLDEPETPQPSISLMQILRSPPTTPRSSFEQLAAPKTEYFAAAQEITLPEMLAMPLGRYFLNKQILEMRHEIAAQQKKNRLQRDSMLPSYARQGSSGHGIKDQGMMISLAESLFQAMRGESSGVLSRQQCLDLCADFGMEIDFSPIDDDRDSRGNVVPASLSQSKRQIASKA